MFFGNIKTCVFCHCHGFNEILKNAIWSVNLLKNNKVKSK